MVNLKKTTSKKKKPKNTHLRADYCQLQDLTGDYFLFTGELAFLQCKKTKDYGGRWVWIWNLEFSFTNFLVTSKQVLETL